MPFETYLNVVTIICAWFIILSRFQQMLTCIERKFWFLAMADSSMVDPISLSDPTSSSFPKDTAGGVAFLD